MARRDVELTAKERAILERAAEGDTTEETAPKVGLAVDTVRWYRNQRIRPKLDARNITNAVAIALRRGLIE